MERPCFLERIRVCGGWGEAPTIKHTVLFSGQGGSFITLLEGGPTWTHQA